MDADYVIDHQSIINVFYKAGYITENEKKDLRYNLLVEKHSSTSFSSTDVDGRKIKYTYYDRNRYGIVAYSTSIMVLDDKDMIDFIVYYDIENNKFIEESNRNE